MNKLLQRRLIHHIINGESQIKEESRKREVKTTAATENLISCGSDTTQNDVVKPTLSKQIIKSTNMVWKPKTTQQAQQAKQLIVSQRSSAKEQQDKTVSEEAAGKFIKSKSTINSCPSQGIMLTNRFKCLEDKGDS
ncbi:unnamed protein product [Arabidopsis halleri]